MAFEDGAVDRVRRACVAMLAAAATGALADGLGMRGGRMIPERLQVAFEVRRRGEALVCAYRGSNSYGAPILVFDRLYAAAAGKWLTDWAYVWVIGDKAWASRGLFPLPRGLQHENPEVPHGREVAPGQVFEGEFRLDLPLADRNPYLGLSRRGPAQAVTVDELAFKLGWIPMPDTLPPALAPVERDGERLWLLPYGLVYGTQQSAGMTRMIDPIPALWAGR